MSQFKQLAWKRWPLAMRCAVFSLLYFCGAILGETLSFRDQDFSTFWPPCGLMLGTLLLHRKHDWPAFWLAGVIATVLFETLIHHHPASLGLALASGNFLQGALGAMALLHWCRGRPSVRRVHDVCKLTTVGLLTPLVSATIGVGAAQTYFPKILFAQLWPLWRNADALGVLLIAPLVLAAADRGARALSSSARIVRFGEAVAVLVAATCMADAAFGPESTHWRVFAFPYVTFPGLLWAAIRLGPGTAAACSFAIACVAIWNTSISIGPFHQQARDVREAAILLQIFVVVTHLFALLPAAIMAQWRSAEAKIRALNLTLEQRVSERTAELQESLSAREKAEAALREAHSYLEERVRDRTAALRESESVLRSFFESGPMMMGIVDVTADDIIHVSDNPAAAALIGSTPAQMRGKRDRDLGISTGKFQLWKSHYEQGERTRRPVRFEYSYDTSDGKKWLSVVVAWISARSEGCSRFSYIAEDVTDRERAKETLHRFAMILEATTDFVGIADKRGRVIFINRAGRALIGYEETHDIAGAQISSFHPPWAEDVVAHEGIPVAMLEGSWSAETALLGIGGREIPVSQVILSHKSPDGAVEFLSTIIRDMSAQKEAEEKIKSSLDEKEVLLKEIHHRVKNNMQIVSSLLQLQSSYIHDPQALTMFHESRDRIKSMALIHEQLYQSNDLAQIDFPEYLRNLLSTIFSAHRSHGDAGARIETNLHVDPISLDLDTAIPVGLIVNELVTNCLKYAFKEREHGTVFVELRQGTGERADGCTLIVSDDGNGLPDNFSFAKATSLGLRLVRILAKQIGGDLQFSNGAGAEFCIHFPHRNTLKHL